MPRVKELHHTAQLRCAGFGWPPPRHGLHLLYWFSTKCLYFDEYDKMVPCSSPDKGDFGFHLFENRPDQNGFQLLPNINFPYYVVGNLNSDRADELPDYIREEYTGLYDNSNNDRIIVSLKNGWFDKVYITEHRDEWNYDPKKTYSLNEKVIKYIRRKNRTGFLNEMSIRPTESVPQRHEAHIAIKNSTVQEPHRSRGLWDYCTIL